MSIERYIDTERMVKVNKVMAVILAAWQLSLTFSFAASFRRISIAPRQINT
jgi:hypothetical protein